MYMVFMYVQCVYMQDFYFLKTIILRIFGEWEQAYLVVQLASIFIDIMFVCLFDL